MSITGDTVISKRVLLRAIGKVFGSKNKELKKNDKARVLVEVVFGK